MKENKEKALYPVPLKIIKKKKSLKKKYIKEKFLLKKNSLCFVGLLTQNTFQFYNLHGKQSFKKIKNKKSLLKKTKLN